MTAVASAGNYHSQDLPVFSLLSTSLKKKTDDENDNTVSGESGVCPLSCSVSQLTETPAWL